MLVPHYRWVVLGQYAWLDTVGEIEGTPGTMLIKPWKEDVGPKENLLVMMARGAGYVLKSFYSARTKKDSRWKGDGVHEFIVDVKTLGRRNIYGYDYMGFLEKPPSMWALLSLPILRRIYSDRTTHQKPWRLYGRYGMGNVAEGTPEQMKMAQAERRARASALSILQTHHGKRNGLKLYHRYLAKGCVPVKAASGLIYLVTGGHAFVDVYKGKKRVQSLCLLLQGGYCDTDQFLMRYMKLRDGKEGEAWYNEWANKQMIQPDPEERDELQELEVEAEEVEKIKTPLFDPRPLTEIAQEIRSMFVSPLPTVADAIAKSREEQAKTMAKRKEKREKDEAERVRIEALRVRREAERQPADYVPVVEERPVNRPHIRIGYAEDYVSLAPR